MTVAVKVAGNVFEHTVGELTVTTGFEFTVTTSEQMFVHPFVVVRAVTVNEPGPSALTTMESPFVGPTMAPLPVNDQLTDEPGMLKSTV